MDLINFMDFNNLMSYFVYILKCKDGTLYTGITNDLAKRLEAHKKGTGARYTRSHPPEKIVYSEKYRTKGLALNREAEIKRLSRPQKLKLIA